MTGGDELLTFGGSLHMVDHRCRLKVCDGQVDVAKTDVHVYR